MYQIGQADALVIIKTEAIIGVEEHSLNTSVN